LATKWSIMPIAGHMRRDNIQYIILELSMNTDKKEQFHSLKGFVNMRTRTRDM
jgi:hypothetical protein